MALTLNAAVTGTSVQITWDNATLADGAYSVQIKRFTPLTDCTDEDFGIEDFNAGTAVGGVNTTKNGSVTDSSAAACTSYKYIAYDAKEEQFYQIDVTTHSGKEFSESFEERNLLAGSQQSVFVSNQNTYGAISFNLPISGGNVAIIAVKTDSPISESVLNSKFSGANDRFQIIASSNVSDVSGMQAKIDGRIHLKYDPQ